MRVSDRSLLVTAGPTYEPIDDVRYVANRSSGQMGVAIAGAACEAGWDVTLLLGPVSLVPPARATVLRFESSGQLEALLADRFPRCGVLVMAAAVADYRPAQRSAGKLPRRAEKLVLELEPVPDLVAQCARRKTAGQRILGFALESPEVLLARASEKLARKGIDAVVANPLATMGAAEISPVVIRRDGTQLRPATATLEKSSFARWLVDRIADGALWC